VSEVLILTGVELEARTIARELELPALSNFAFHVFGRRTIRIAAVGLRAGLLSQRWLSLLDGLHDPLILSAGVCGGLDPKLASGTVVVPESVLSPSGERLNVTPSRYAAALSVGAGQVATGCLVTSREIVSTPKEKSELHAKTGAVAVDMESSLILSAAATAGCVSLVIRGVSDDANQTLLPELIALVTPEGRVRRARAVALALTQPATIPHALAFQRHTRRALRAVARLLAALI
jgi:adenosylhomocysteine nucleosidase